MFGILKHPASHDWRRSRMISMEGMFLLRQSYIFIIYYITYIYIIWLCFDFIISWHIGMILVRLKRTQKSGSPSWLSAVHKSCRLKHAQRLSCYSSLFIPFRGLPLMYFWVQNLIRLTLRIPLVSWFLLLYSLVILTHVWSQNNLEMVKQTNKLTN